MGIPMPNTLPTFDTAVPERLSDAEANALRQELLAKLPRIGTQAITTPLAFRRRLEDVALQLGDLQESYRQEGRSDWWHMADLLDDVLDLLDALPHDKQKL